MTKKNVLVFPCGSEIGLEIHKSMSMSTVVSLYGGSSVSDHGEFVYRNYIDNIPNIDDKNFISALNKVIKKYRIDFIFPAHDSVVLRLAEAFENKELASSVMVLSSPLETCRVARSKSLTYKILNGIVDVPLQYENIESITSKDFPLFVKPDVGQGSKGASIVKDKLDLEYSRAHNDNLIVTEYLPGKEYTVDCFTNKDGELVFCEGRERSRVSNGISVRSGTVQDKRFREIAKKINSTLKFRGVWFFQVKENNKKDLVLMEVAPRIAGTMGLVRSKGVNMPLLTLFDAMNIDITIVKNDNSIIIDRALQNSYKQTLKYKYVYLDFDDTVIVNKQINTQVMSFVYQCINKNIRIFLITKHALDIHATLSKYRLDTVFDRVIHLGRDDNKSKYITKKNAIFIDDSHTERAAVKKTHNIPVFDTHAIESLMEA